MKLLHKLIPLLVLFLVSCSNGSTSSSSNAGIQYTTLNYTGALPAGGDTGLTGIRQVGDTANVYITGSYSANGQNNGTLYVGPISGGGTYYVYNYPGSDGCNVYSADNGDGGNVLLTGSFVESGANTNYGFIYNGPVSESNQNAGYWESISFPESQTGGQTIIGTIPHSIMGGFVVGNYATPISAGQGFIYNISTQVWESVSYPDARYTSIYGIWYNGGESYTITGGYSEESSGILSVGFLADYNSDTGSLSNWIAYHYENDESTAVITHFEGITTDGNGGYNLAASGAESTSGIGVALVNVRRTISGGFADTAIWIPAWYPGSYTTTGDTVYQNYLLGVYKQTSSSALNGYVATIPTSAY